MYRYHQTLDFPNAKLVGNIERVWSQDHKPNTETFDLGKFPTTPGITY